MNEKKIEKKLEINKQGSNILITNIKPQLTIDEVIRKVEENILIDDASRPIGFDQYLQKGQFSDPYAVTFTPGNIYQALIMTSDGSVSFDKSLSEIKSLGYFQATLMDCLHIWSLTDRNVQGYTNNLSFPVSQLVQYLIAPGTKTDSKVQWSCIPRLSLKKNPFLDSIPWRNLNHYQDHGVVAIKQI